MKQQLTKEERLNRVVARGETSDHAHCITGNATIERVGDQIFINTEDSTAVIKHLLESKWMEGIEQWSGEHEDIALDKEVDIRHGDVLLKHLGKGRYEYRQANEYDPFNDIIRATKD